MAASSSLGAIDHSLVVQDTLRRADVRGNIFQMVIIEGYHKPAVQRLRIIIATKEEYTKYLLGLRHDVALIEKALQARPIEAIPSLSQVYRTAAIEADVRLLDGKNVEMAKLVSTRNHAGHLDSIAGEPHKLIAHLAVYHLGFMFGGQKISETIKTKNWAQNSVALYQFENLGKLLHDFIGELTKYLHGLPDEQYAEFTKEIETAWKFACHIESLEVLIS